jgi:hypothetical protein
MNTESHTCDCSISRRTHAGGVSAPAEYRAPQAFGTSDRLRRLIARPQISVVAEGEMGTEDQEATFTSHKEGAFSRKEIGRMARRRLPMWAAFLTLIVILGLPTDASASNPPPRQTMDIDAQRSSSTDGCGPEITDNLEDPMNLRFTNVRIPYSQETVTGYHTATETWKYYPGVKSIARIAHEHWNDTGEDALTGFLIGFEIGGVFGGPVSAIVGHHLSDNDTWSDHGEKYVAGQPISSPSWAWFRDDPNNCFDQSGYATQFPHFAHHARFWQEASPHNGAPGWQNVIGAAHHDITCATAHLKFMGIINGVPVVIPTLSHPLKDGSNQYVESARDLAAYFADWRYADGSEAPPKTFDVYRVKDRLTHAYHNCRGEHFMDDGYTWYVRQIQQFPLPSPMPIHTPR